MELFEEHILLATGNMVKKTVKVDQTALLASRGKFACTCVEIDLNKPLVPRIQILNKPKNVEYEGLYLEYFSYSQYGHKSFECYNGGEAPNGPPMARAE